MSNKVIKIKTEPGLISPRKIKKEISDDLQASHDSKKASIPSTRKKIKKEFNDENSDDTEIKQIEKVVATKRKKTNEPSKQNKIKLERSTSNKQIKKEFHDEDSDDTTSKQIEKAVATKRKKTDGPSKQKKIKLEKQNEAQDDCEFNSLVIKKEDWLAAAENLNGHVASNIVRLFGEDNTIPFIARYRQHLTEGMDAERLRHVKQSYDTMELVIVKAENLLKTLKKEGVDGPELKARVVQARSIEELELIAAPFKKGSKTTLAARAREAQLEEPGLAVLHGTSIINPDALVDCSISGREDVSKVRHGLQHIVADVIAKNPDLLEFAEDLKRRERIILEVTMRKGAEEHANKDKYDLYKQFNVDIRDIKEHQVLAINRGEDQKVLSVKVNIPESFWEKLRNFCNKHWLEKGCCHSERTAIFKEAVKDAINRLISPLLARQIRSRLTEAAERAAIDTFSANLRRLLLSAPVRGRTVLAIDPGAKMGCKVGIISPQGVPLHTGKIFLTDASGRARARDILIEWVRNYECDIIAVGNGSYCRETESFLSSLIQCGSFKPLDVSYIIVDEQGVSIYSCSPEAKKEFPDLDPTLISAISLGRRLQDPLAELVKVEPKHLGVGMYQHDVPEKKLTSSLDEVVSECVSFVGVDINTASIHLLKRVAGLTKTRAASIVSRRENEGTFTNRQQLLKVKGIGSKSFQQCAGFIRILPATAMSREKLNPLDQTEIHPEDYSFALRVLDGLRLNVQDVGSAGFIAQVARQTPPPAMTALAEKYGVTLLQMEQLIGALQKQTDHDLRTLSQAPLFRRGITTMESIKPGDVLTGVVRNVVAFGAFVDVGVGKSGLIHSSQLGYDRSRWVQLGDRVQVQVVSVDLARERIQLKLMK